MSIAWCGNTAGRFCVLACVAALCAAGCGTSETKPPQNGAAGGGLPTASIAASDDDGDEDGEIDPDDDKIEFIAPQEGTPEWLVHEATRLLLEPPPESQDVEVLKAYRRERNEKIIALAQQAVEAIHSDPTKERLFSAAVHNLMEARLQLALAGDAGQAELLYQDAAALYKRDPQSPAAAEAAHTLVTLAYTNAKNSHDSEHRWLKEFGLQSRNFAVNFPTEERRSLPLLFTAARSCELAGLAPEARECYELIQQTFPKSPFAERVGPILRRLKLIGNPAQLAGPTLDGERLALDDFLGEVVLVVFWSTETKPFLEELPELLKTTRAYSRRGLKVLGVNLDQESSPVQEFLVTHKVPWPQIFFPEPEKRGWNNPIASYYGIMDIPAMWLINRSGAVVTTSLKSDSLGSEIEKLFEQSQPQGGADEPTQPSGD